MFTLGLSLAEFVYISFVLLGGGLVLFRALTYLGTLREGRLQRLARRGRFDPVPTATPLSDPKQVATHRGERSIERQFTVMRRMVVPMITGFTLFLASIPILASSAASTLSLISGALAVVVGFASRPFLENAISGLVISGSGLLRIGDTVRIDDFYGTVEDITPTHTAVKLWDWRRYLIPNTTMLQRPMLNHSLYDQFEWAWVDFWVAPGADLDEVQRLAVEVAKSSEYRTGAEAPYFWVTRIDKEAVGCAVATWAASATDAWSLRADVRQRIMGMLRQRGITTMQSRHQLDAEGQAAGMSVSPPGGYLGNGPAGLG